MHGPSVLVSSLADVLGMAVGAVVGGIASVALVEMSLQAQGQTRGDYGMAPLVGPLFGVPIGVALGLFMVYWILRLISSDVIISSGWRSSGVSRPFWVAAIATTVPFIATPFAVSGFFR